jgi:hypothetical protein
MWPSGWKRHHLPYRGEPQPKFPKRRRQVRDLKAEKRANILTISIIFILMAIVFGCIIFNPNGNNDSDKLRQGIAVLVITLILIVPIAAGLSSVNKFRKGYDVDVSEEAEKDDNNKSEDSRNDD